MSLFSHFSPEAIIELLVVLGIMVLVHEFGHFAVAKLCGIRVETFSIGFGKRLFGFRRGDTDYRLSLLPLGGYVKMAGDTPGEAPSGDPGEFNAHPRWQRILVALAGPVANFILAIAMMTALYMFHYEKPAYLDGAPMADYVPANTPAAAVGLEPGDTIVHFADQENPSWDDIGNKSLLNLNRVVPFSYMHDGKRVDTNLKIESKSTPERFTLDAVGLVPLFQKTPIQIADVGSGTPAERAGLKPKDIIQSMDGITIHSIIALQAYLQDQAGKPMELTLLRDGQKVNTTLTPEISETTGVKAYRMGIQLMAPPAEVEKHSFPQALGESVTFFTKSSLLIRDVFKGMFTRHVSVKQLSGPIGIGQMVHIAFQMKGWNPLVELMSGISINLGIFNLLPIPILDGGMILFLLIESLFRRDINQVAKERIYQAAFVCLLCFAAFVIFNDLTKLVAR
ncbi:regulator of sigma E protease [Granulicella pectinivorans]|uniref:Zinc metalloprotease n=1 Tax=Granulicella pectinivorans TaxID=474950 RepID=A0A1I6MBW1_9BACT|nr:RIP metalloprotease RseP [Granulicella pectinivorans]SFS13236.1 regulator of sigma E protease [Granulicella pectinivorans]